MRLNEYVKWTEKTCARLATYRFDIFHMLMGMTTEVGELTDAFKKNLAYEKPIDWVNVEEELGDLMFYIASFCKIADIDLEAVIEKNVKKLEHRYPEKFSNDKANNRDLDGERKILEEKQ